MSSNYRATAADLAKQLRKLAAGYEKIAQAPNRQLAVIALAQLGGGLLEIAATLSEDTNSIMADLMKNPVNPEGRN